jgi:integrase
MRKMLTAALVAKTLPPATGRIEINDTIQPQLALRVTSSGARSYVVRTRVKGQGVQVRCTLGDARVMELRDARDAASEILRKCKAGVNPQEERRLQIVADDQAKKLLAPAVIEDFLVRHASKNRTALETRRIFENDVIPRWKDKLITEVTRADVVAILDHVEDRASPCRANRVLAAIRKMFNWSVSRGLLTVSPIVKGMARKGEIARDRYLSPYEIRMVWQAADQIGGAFGPVLQMLLATGQRRGEVAEMRWDALDLTNERIWTLTAEDTKAKRSHIVPLTDLTLSLLEKRPRLGDYVFTTTGNGPVTGFGKAKEDLDMLILDIVQDDAEARGIGPENVKDMPHWRLHDLRRTVATHMEDALGIPPHIVGSVLNHDPKSYKGITATYTRGSLLYERRRALTAWSRFLGLVTDAHKWAKVEKLLSPETEADAARTDEFRRMIQADADTWLKYLDAINEPKPANVVAMRR